MIEKQPILNIATFIIAEHMCNLNCCSDTIYATCIDG